MSRTVVPIVVTAKLINNLSSASYVAVWKCTEEENRTGNVHFCAVKYNAGINITERDFVEMCLSQKICLLCVKCITEH